MNRSTRPFKTVLLHNLVFPCFLCRIPRVPTTEMAKAVSDSKNTRFRFHPLEGEGSKERHSGLWVSCLLFSLVSGLPRVTSLLLVLRGLRFLAEESPSLSHGFKTSLCTWLQGKPMGCSLYLTLAKSTKQPQPSQPVSFKSSGPGERQHPFLSV